MKDSKFGQFLKKNGAVIFSICGILVIAVAVMLIVNGSIKESESNPEQDYRVDLNEMAEGDNTESTSQLAQGEINEQDMAQLVQGEKSGEETRVEDNAQVAESPVDSVANTGENEGNATETSESVADNQQMSDMQPVEVAESLKNEESEFVDEAQAASSAGSSVEQKDAVDLFFEDGMEILWPVEGNVVLNYSADHLIYHPTLDQFRTHDAIAISATAGTEVVAAADGVVSSIEESVQTGVTVTTAIGNDYYLVYGQLEDSELKIGDSVSQGEVIGTIAKVSRFYSKEGDNLYFQVRCGEETLNPMSLLGRVNEETVDTAEGVGTTEGEVADGTIEAEETMTDAVEAEMPEE